MISAVTMEEELTRALDAMSDDWLSVSTFIDLQLAGVGSSSALSQNCLTDCLHDYFSQAQHVDTFKAVAWDLILPLKQFWCHQETRKSAQRLLDLAIRLGNQKEVLMKISEALERIDLEDAEDAEIELDFQFYLLSAQETILLGMSTRRPSRFAAEYTKNIVHAMQLCQDHSQDASQDRYCALIVQSMSHGALSALAEYEDHTEQEARIVEALLSSFLTYAASFLWSIDDPPESFVLFQQIHPHLTIKADPRDHTHTDTKRLSSDHALAFSRLVERKGPRVDSLWDCGTWNKQERIVANHNDTNDDSDHGLDEADVPYSPLGSALILARALIHEDKVSGIVSITESQVKACASIVFELCACEEPSLVTADACLCICSIVLANIATHSATDRDTEDHLQLIQSLSFISAHSTHPQLRHVAHFLSKDTLALSSETFRLTYYLGVFTECPYKVLLTSTLSLLKDEISNDSPFWHSEDILQDLLHQVLALQEPIQDDGNEFEHLYWIQVMTFIIFVFQRIPAWSSFRQLAATWMQTIKSHLEQATGLSLLTRELLEMHGERVSALLATTSGRETI